MSSAVLALVQPGGAERPATGPLAGCLIVSIHRERFQDSGAIVVSTAAEGMHHLMRGGRFATVFADVGKLGDSSGYRFASQASALPACPRLYLMAERVTPVEEQYASRNGAAGVIARSMPELVAVHTAKPSAAAARAGGSAVAKLVQSQSQATRLAQIQQSLQKHAGPVAASLVQRAMEAQQRRGLDEVSLEMLVKTLAGHIDDARHRAMFIAETNFN